MKINVEHSVFLTLLISTELTGSAVLNIVGYETLILLKQKWK